MQIFVPDNLNRFFHAEEVQLAVNMPANAANKLEGVTLLLHIVVDDPLKLLLPHAQTVDAHVVLDVLEGSPQALQLAPQRRQPLLKAPLHLGHLWSQSAHPPTTGCESGSVY
eukprot:341235-Prorocentrum_minimum.AAC.3